MSNAPLTGRTQGPRGIALRCPGCGNSLRALDLEEPQAEVDVCDACGGIWLDWFDGEVRVLATETLRVSSTDVQASDHDRKSNEPLAVGACPRCTKQLVPERYIMSAPLSRDGGVVTKPTGAELLRCEDCMGSFVTRASAEVLAFLSASDEPPPSKGAPDSKLKPLPWERFVNVLKSFIGSNK